MMKILFDDKYIPEPNSGCWIWLMSADKLGYGWSSLKKKTLYAHRHSWLIYRGVIPDKQFVLHKCDNPYCINPDHLFLGIQKDNMRDMAAKGRNRNQNSGMTACFRGHSFTDTGGKYKNHRYCKKCKIDKQRTRRQLASLS